MLDSSAPSFCYYRQDERQEKLSLENLNKAIEYCQRNNLFITVVYPEYQLDSDICQLLKIVPHVKIISVNNIELLEEGDLLVVNYNHQEESFEKIPENDYLNIILRLKMSEVCDIESIYYNYRKKFCRLSIIITDIYQADENALNQYRLNLVKVKDYIYSGMDFDNNFQISIITDRIILNEMNNCNAGLVHFTIAPNGKFYICPGFYLDVPNCSIGSLEEGIKIANKHLLTIHSSPICSLCDCYHCKRCVYLNKKATLELNTPSHEQCVISHHERNTAGILLETLQKRGVFPSIKPIRPLFYLDPFEIIKL